MPKPASPNVAPVDQAIMGQQVLVAGHALALHLSSVGLQGAFIDEAAGDAPRLVVASEHATPASALASALCDGTRSWGQAD
jgi:hypothetical protein